jgi:hypothetical protein
LNWRWPRIRHSTPCGGLRLRGSRRRRAERWRCCSKRTLRCRRRGVRALSSRGCCSEGCRRCSEGTCLGRRSSTKGSPLRWSHGSEGALRRWCRAERSLRRRSGAEGAPLRRRRGTPVPTHCRLRRSPEGCPGGSSRMRDRRALLRRRVERGTGTHERSSDGGERRRGVGGGDAGHEAGHGAARRSLVPHGRTHHLRRN